MLMSDPRHQPGILYDPNKPFLTGNTSGISGFLEFSAGKPLLRQKNSRPGRVNTPKAEVFPARKSKPSKNSSIPGHEE